MMGFDVRAMSEELERRGYGDAMQIQRAIENGDEKGLAFVPKLAKELMDQYPDQARRAAAMFGKGFPQSRNRLGGM